MVDVDKIQQEITVATMLFKMGKATIEEITAYFQQHTEVNDNDDLIAVLTEVNNRITEREVPPVDPTTTGASGS